MSVNYVYVTICGETQWVELKCGLSWSMPSEIATYMVCWYAGMLVCWYAGMLVCWYAGMLVCWYAGMLVCWYVDMLVC